MYRVIETSGGAFHIEEFSVGLFTRIKKWRWIFRYPHNDQSGAIAHTQRLSKDKTEAVWVSD